MRSFRIEFKRDITADEREDFWPEEEDAPDSSIDETEFNTNEITPEEISRDLAELFNAFVAENGLTNVEVLNIYEVTDNE